MVVRIVNTAGNGCAHTAPSIDGFSGDDDISNNFATKLRAIINLDKSRDGHSGIMSTLEESLHVGDLTSTFVS